MCFLWVVLVLIIYKNHEFIFTKQTNDRCIMITFEKMGCNYFVNIFADKQEIGAYKPKTSCAVHFFKHVKKEEIFSLLNIFLFDDLSKKHINLQTKSYYGDILNEAIKSMVIYIGL